MKKFKKLIAIFLIMFSLAYTAGKATNPDGISVMNETWKPFFIEEEEIIYPY